MKNQVRISIWFGLFFFFGKIMSAQDCSLPTATKILHGNKVKATILNSGDLFWDRDDIGFYQVPADVLKTTSTIANNGIWLGGVDSLGNLRVSAARYNTPTRKDFSAGFYKSPLDSAATLQHCQNYDRLWEVYGFEIKTHLNDFQDNGIIDHPIPNIFSYPALGNPFFENIHGFELPWRDDGIAPFFDSDSDGIYNPSLGDYPLPASLHASIIPEHLVFCIFNDGTTPNTQTNGTPLNFEIFLTAWSLSCEDNNLLNYTTFLDYKIGNQGNETIDSVFVGNWTDFALGCWEDDYAGSIPSMNTYYAYNRDSTDADCSSSSNWDNFSYEENPPVQAVTILNQDMTSYINYYRSVAGVNFHDDPITPDHYYHYLNGKWKDGSSITVGGNGHYTSNSFTNFMFPDHPSDSSGWSMLNAFNYSAFTRSIASSSFGSIAPNESVHFNLAFSYYQSDSLNHLETVNLVYENTPLLQQAYDNGFENYCNILPLCITDCVWAGETDGDSTVTGSDILNIGLAFGTAGQRRFKPTNWSPQSASDWNDEIDGINYKHLDCNDNGKIDSADFQVVESHFQNTYAINPPPDVYQSGEELYFYPFGFAALDTIESGDFARGRIRINLDEPIYGLSFIVEFDTTYFRSIAQTLSNDLWLGENKYQFSKHDFSKGEMHFSYTKLDGQNESPINEEIIGYFFIYSKTIDVPEVATTFRFKNIRAVLADGSEISVGGTDFVSRIFNYDLVKTINLQKTQIQIFPNPTSDFLNIKLENPEPTQIIIFNSFGKKVLEKTEVAKSELQLSTTALASGVYFITIQIRGEQFIQKFIKM